MAFGSSNNYGPGCGKCFKLTLLNSYTGTPPFFPNTKPSVVVKVTDLCPLSAAGWCSGTENRKNPCVSRPLHSSLLFFFSHLGLVLPRVWWLCWLWEWRTDAGCVAAAVNTLILILHTLRLRFQITSSPQTRSCMGIRHVFSLHNLQCSFRHVRLTRPNQDFGAWNITYASVSCKEWKGWGDEAAKGSAPNLGGCCPANPTVRLLVP